MNYRSSLKRPLSIVACMTLLTSTTSMVSRPAHAQWAVVDVSLNLQQIEAFLEQIAQYAMQAQQLEQAINQYETMVKNTLDLPNATWVSIAAAVNGLNTIIGNGQSIANKAKNIDLAFSTMFPNYRSMRGTMVTRASYQSSYQTWSDNTRAGVQTNLATATQLLNARASDQSAIAGLQTQAQAAEGNLQAVKAAAAVASQEVIELQQLKILMAQDIATQTQYLAELQAKQQMSQVATEQALSGSTPAFGSGKQY